MFLLIQCIIIAGDVVCAEVKMPLNLMCRVVSAQRNAQYKLTIESSEVALEMPQLFPGS